MDAGLQTQETIKLGNDMANLCLETTLGRGTEWVRQNKSGSGRPVRLLAVFLREASQGTKAVAAGVGDASRFERFRRKLVWDLVINWMWIWESVVLRREEEGEEEGEGR